MCCNVQVFESRKPDTKTAEPRQPQVPHVLLDVGVPGRAQVNAEAETAEETLRTTAFSVEASADLQLGGQARMHMERGLVQVYGFSVDLAAG